MHVSARTLTRQGCSSFVHLFPFPEQISVVPIGSCRNGKHVLQELVCTVHSKDLRSIKCLINQVIACLGFGLINEIVCMTQ